MPFLACPWALLSLPRPSKHRSKVQHLLCAGGARFLVLIGNQGKRHYFSQNCFC